MPTFNQGMQAGMQSVQFGMDRADRNRQRGVDNARLDARDAQDRLDRELDRKRKDQLGESLNLELQTRRDEAARFVEASAAFDRFNAAASMLDPGNPAALDQYATVTKQYLPTILKHEGIAKKWEAMDRVFKQGQMFTVRKVADAAAIKSMEEAAQIAPEVMMNPPKLPDGTPDYASIRNIIADRRKEIEDHQVKLRRASTEARAEAEASGAYGGRTAAKPQMGPGSKAELDAVADELRIVNKALLESNNNPDRKLELVNRKAALQRRLRSFDSSAQQAPEQVSQPAASSQPIKVGDFTIRQLD